MGYVAARCPKCGGDLQLNNKMEKGYCAHCGTPIYFQDAIQRIKIVGPVQVAGFAKLESLIKLIKKDLEFGMNRTPEFRDRLNRAIEMDPNNQYLYDLQSSEIWNAKIVEGKLVEYTGNVKRVVIPDCVTVIGRFALKMCTNLEEIVLPRSITHISDRVFFKEEKLVISAYKNTYAARFALISPAYLQIIDDDENNQEHIRKIEEALTEIVGYKNIVEKKIKANYSTKLFGKVMKPIILLAVLIFIAFLIPNGLQSATGKLFAGIIVVFAAVLFLFLPAYLTTCRRLANKNQILRFYKKSNDLLTPLGITDFRYLKNIWESSRTDLAYEAKHMERVREQILTMDISQFMKNPDVNLSFFSYLAGERPKNLDKY